jgi:cyclopropane fatty-acyl-phospholipid synthase-like methyltransferase
MPISSNWYENFFDGLALDLWRKAIPPEQTRAEADFLIEALQCNPRGHVLDVPCGNGRLSFALAERGYRVTGLDISEEFIESARRLAASLTTDQPPVTADGSEIAFILGDMRSVEGESVYDGAYCFGNSFGFLAYADMEKFLGGVSRALKPGSRFIVETGMAAESLLPKFEAEASYQVQDIKMTVKEQYLAEESCVDSEYTFERDGQREVKTAKHWIYTTAEIRRMLERAGFLVVEMFGSLKGEPFVLGAQELFVIAQHS